MGTKIYNVVLPKGSYEDYFEKVLTVTTDKQAAEDFVAECNAYIEEGYKADAPIDIDIFVTRNEYDNCQFIGREKLKEMGYDANTIVKIYKFFNKYIDLLDSYGRVFIQEHEISESPKFNKEIL